MADENTKSDIPAKVDEVSDFDLPNEIIAACTALETVDGIDTAIMTKQDEARKKRIIRKSLAIIDNHIGYLYDCILEENKDID